ncbi:Sugar kinase of the NBD/HSP70 family, may contain an N-terminal HTH domain [Paramicrobacterium humi]|uniref:Sugar kinase of the NBD/HSP70 family, may contain an N-terminal HTH domain n=1 Tax=Paramicrobacterium humi TaxID=640635 RepID=A0A1H4L9H9_9MICO|nr:ROK family protein [Microbacterium humi]SEB67098.1 Sugar kinase of the NBD/HSP70 family, may contain an N-terminal HTH domain [Microbacterium humi]
MSRRNTTGAGVVLDLIRSGEATTRHDLQEALGWSRVTLGRRLDELVRASLVVRAGQSASSGGRPREEFEVNAERGVILAIDAGSSHTRIGITDLAGKVLVESEADLGSSDRPEDVFTWAKATFEELLLDIGKARSDVEGVGIGVPFAVSGAGGGIEPSDAAPRWSGVRVRDYFSGWCEEAVFAVDRDVNVLAIGEARFGWPEVRDLVVVKAGIRVGCAVVTGGRIVRGSTGQAGLLSAPLRYQPGARLKPLEYVASGGVIQSRLSRSGLKLRTSADIAELGRAGNKEVTALLVEIGEILGFALADVVGLVNPAAVVIGGNLADGGDGYISAVRRSIMCAAHELSRQRLIVERSRLGDKAGVRGAAALALDALFEPSRITAISGSDLA